MHKYSEGTVKLFMEQIFDECRIGGTLSVSALVDKAAWAFDWPVYDLESIEKWARELALKEVKPTRYYLQPQDYVRYEVIDENDQSSYDYGYILSVDGRNIIVGDELDHNYRVTPDSTIVLIDMNRVNVHAWWRP